MVHLYKSGVRVHFKSFHVFILNMLKIFQILELYLNALRYYNLNEHHFYPFK